MKGVLWQGCLFSLKNYLIFQKTNEKQEKMAENKGK